MKNIQIRKLYYHIRHRFFTLNNIVMVIALLIAASWVWGSVQAMERNYALQKDLNRKERQLKLIKLQTATLQYEQNYYKSDEFKELAVRERLGLVKPGEKVLILPPNSKTAQNIDKKLSKKTTTSQVQPSNMQQWINFLFGGSSRSL